MSQAWLELCDNPQALARLYTSPPPLIGVEMMEVRAFREGPRVQLVLDLPTFPEAPPARWRRQGFNVAQLTLDLHLNGPWSLTGWATTNRVDLTLEVSEGGLEVLAEGETLRLSASASSVSIAGVSGYLDAARA